MKALAGTGALVRLILRHDRVILPLWVAVLDLSPFAHLPKVPGSDASAVPLVWLTLIAVTLAAAGLLGLRRRDVPESE